MQFIRIDLTDVAKPRLHKHIKFIYICVKVRWIKEKFWRLTNYITRLYMCFLVSLRTWILLLMRRQTEWEVILDFKCTFRAPRWGWFGYRWHRFVAIIRAKVTGRNWAAYGHLNVKWCLINCTWVRESEQVTRNKREGRGSWFTPEQGSRSGICCSAMMAFY